eukprot:jgi/Botrbrau1/12304/Bobra.0205s0003.1
MGIVALGRLQYVHSATRLIRYRRRSTTSLQALAPASTVSVIRKIQNDLVQKRRSAAEVVDEYLDRLVAVEGKLGSFITVTEEVAREAAAQLDARIAAHGTDGLGPLAGVPVGIKDTLCTKGIRTTAGSHILENYTPPYSATSVDRLMAAGALLVGKCNCDAFAMGSTTEASDFHVTRNPWDIDRVPGGSSGGSAAAVAGGQCVAALGSDTGGSIRQPAHFCGVVGIKPTYGRVSRYGLIAYGSSLDCVGPLAPTVEDAAILLSCISGFDPRDSTSSQADVIDFSAGLPATEGLPSKPLEGTRIAMIKETVGEGVTAGVMNAFKGALRHLGSLGAEICEVSLPTFDVGLAAYYVIATSEASSNLARYDGVRYGLRKEGNDVREMYGNSREAGLGSEVKRRILVGTYALSAGYYDAYYKRAQQVRTLVQQEMSAALKQYNFLISPVAPTTAYRLGEVRDDPLQMYKGDLMTVNLNLAGLPAVTVPCGFEECADGKQLPVGMQLIGKLFGEADIIKAAHIFEQTASFARATPPPLR